MENFNLIIEVFQNVAPLTVALGRALKSSIELSFLSPANLVLRVLGLFGQRSVARRDYGELFHVPDFQDTPNKTYLKVLFYGVMACCVKGCKMLLSYPVRIRSCDLFNRTLYLGEPLDAISSCGLWPSKIRIPSKTCFFVVVVVVVVVVVFFFLQLYYLFLKTNNITKNIGMFQLHQANNYQRNNIKTKNEDYDKNI